MSFIDHRAKRMTKKNVKEHIKAFLLESINENNTPHHFELEKSYLNDTKISDVLGLFVIKENEYRLLITSLFENDLFINDITASQEFYNPISTQDIIPSQKQIIPSSSSTTKIIPSSSSSTKIIPSSSSSSKLNVIRNVVSSTVYKKLSSKQKNLSLKKSNWLSDFTNGFFER